MPGVEVQTVANALAQGSARRHGVLQPGAEGTMEKTDDAGRVATVFFKTGDDTLELRLSRGRFCSASRAAASGAPSLTPWSSERGSASRSEAPSRRGPACVGRSRTRATSM